MVSEREAMLKKRPCSICRRWFLPNQREGARQKTCTRPECQRERHRRSCLDWHRRNPDYDRGRRLQRRVRKEAIAEENVACLVNPLARLDESVVRDAVGFEGAIIILETGKVIVEWLRDAVDAETEQRCGFARRLMPPGKRDAIGSSAMPP